MCECLVRTLWACIKGRQHNMYKTVCVITAFLFSNAGNLDVDAKDSEPLLLSLNCGQKCLLRGLIKAAKPNSASSGDAYTHSQAQAATIRNKISSLFRPPPSHGNEKSGSGGQGGSEDEFIPMPSFRAPRKRSSTGKQPQKGSTKRKVKEIRLKVVGLSTPRNNTPTGTQRDQCTRTVWIRQTASADELTSKIKEVFNWSGAWELSYQYVNGRYMQPATLSDVENATSWDVETARALMGSGSLYVLRTVPKMKEKEEPNETEVWNIQLYSRTSDCSFMVMYVICNY